MRLIARCCFALALAVTSTHAASVPARNPERMALQQNWSLQSSCKISAGGEQISTLGFAVKGWHRTTVPNTVVAALVADKTFSDPYFGSNLRSLPGMNYSTKTFFANQPMPEDSPFRCSWWYRTEFPLPADFAGRNAWLHLDGINYRANIWINGQKIADSTEVAGTFRIFEFDATKFLHPGKRNALAIEIFAPRENDLALTWVDWNPTPPDKDMGIWKDVYLTATGPVTLRHPFVQTKLDTDYRQATLTISAEVHNASQQPVKGALRAQFEGAALEEPVELAAGETKVVAFTPEKHAPLKLAHPRLWWPYQMGAPNLYTAQLEFLLAGKISDSAKVRFGIREVTAELTSKGYRLFRINGKPVLIRGGGWSSDMLLRRSSTRLRNELRYTKHMGLNTIRQEGKLEQDEFFDMADEMGILVMPGWCCCDMWEHWGDWTPENFKVAGASLEDQVYRLRSHASVLVWLYGSDNPPPAEVEKMYLKILQDEQWPNPAVSSASQTPTAVTGASGVKMTGPYDYVPPNYWLADKEAGGAYGFNTETGPGPAIPPLESLKRFLPADHLWPIDDYWNFHAGGERFSTIDIFRRGMDERYGKPDSLPDFLRKSEAMAYEGERAMFEAYARNKYDSTGVIQWMLNNGWPSLIWHLYDYYLVPAGGYFGTKKACETVHVQYSYDDNSVAVINGEQQPVSGVKVTARLYNLDATLKGSREATLDLLADTSKKAFDLPAIPDLNSTYFLQLELRDNAGRELSSNFYWLSTKPDVLDWKGRADTVYTPQSGFADLTGLNQLPAVKLAVRSESSGHAGENSVRVTVKNPTKAIAFMVQLRLTDASGDDIVPIFWDDNYFSLLPGESREISARYDSSAAKGPPRLQVAGWNVTASSTAITAGK